mmetsp:Transcript_108984/g.340978  ORF Transcript_108984/g.340978 Transcript_108984/m.340978 type:complete len:330 (-) Transcript_108984:244-1233(-)
MKSDQRLLWPLPKRSGGKDWPPSSLPRRKTTLKLDEVATLQVPPSPSPSPSPSSSLQDTAYLLRTPWRRGEGSCLRMSWPRSLSVDWLEKLWVDWMLRGGDSSPPCPCGPSSSASAPSARSRCLAPAMLPQRLTALARRLWARLEKCVRRKGNSGGSVTSRRSPTSSVSCWPDGSSASPATPSSSSRCWAASTAPASSELPLPPAWPLPAGLLPCSGSIFRTLPLAACSCRHLSGSVSGNVRRPPKLLRLRKAVSRLVGGGLFASGVPVTSQNFSDQSLPNGLDGDGGDCIPGLRLGLLGLVKRCIRVCDVDRGEGAATSRDLSFRRVL